MIKIAIFVEGQTELVFIREYLLKIFEYQNVWLECYTLFTNNNFNSTEYSFPNELAAHYFQIINVGNDNAVLSRLLNREEYLWNAGFHKIFGIRDMYFRDYREIVKNSIIDHEVNLRFTESTLNAIKLKAKKPENIHFHFAIMEAEAWILGLKTCFQYIHSDLTTIYIAEKLGFDLDETDPELTFFHPANIISEIYALANLHYNKSSGDINALISHIQKDDFNVLAQCGKCASFKDLHNMLGSL